MFLHFKIIRLPNSILSTPIYTNRVLIKYYFYFRKKKHVSINRNEVVVLVCLSFDDNITKFQL